MAPALGSWGATTGSGTALSGTSASRAHTRVRRCARRRQVTSLAGGMWLPPLRNRARASCCSAGPAAKRCWGSPTPGLGSSEPPSVQDVARDQLFQVAVVPPADLELLGPAEVELDVVLDGEADAAEDLLGHGRDVAERLAGKELGHGGEPGGGAACVARPRRLVDEGLGPVDGSHGVSQVVGDGLEGAEGLVELLAVLGVLDGDVERVAGAAGGL